MPLRDGGLRHRLHVGGDASAARLPWRRGGFTDTGYVLIDVDDDRIVCIETLFYPEFVKALRELLP